MLKLPCASVALILSALLICQAAPCKERDTAAVSTAVVSALLAGRYDNSSQMAQAQENATAQTPAPPHVTVTIEPTQKADWALWRVHMEVDADTVLDAVWVMNISRRAFDGSLALIPYNLRPSVSAATVSATTFDETQWLSLEACALRGEFGKSRIVAHSEGEPCAAEGMGLGGKRAFLPASIERENDSLQVYLIFRGPAARRCSSRILMP